MRSRPHRGWVSLLGTVLAASIMAAMAWDALLVSFISLDEAKRGEVLPHTLVLRAFNSISRLVNSDEGRGVDFNARFGLWSDLAKANVGSRNPGETKQTATGVARTTR